MSPQLVFVVLFAVSCSNAFDMACQPPGTAVRFVHLQDVSPDMTPFINTMKSGALQEFTNLAGNSFTNVASGLGYFTNKQHVCFMLQSSLILTSLVPSYNSMPTSLGTDEPQRSVLDAIVHATDYNWNVPSPLGRPIIILYTNKEPSYPPNSGLSTFDPNNIHCQSHETPSMAQLTAYMNNGTNAFFNLVFVVPDNLINSYRSAFAWLGNRLSVVSAGSDKDTLVDGLSAAMNQIYCGVDPPTQPPPSCTSNTVLQLLHLQDVSWSYSNDMSNLKAKMPALLSTLQAQYFERQVALGTFVDKAIAPSGYWTDYCYREQSTFSTDSIPFINALNAASIRSGRDWAESQYDAIRDGLESTTLGWMTGNSTAGGTKHLLRVVMLATDAGPHTKGDQSGLPATHADGCAYADYPSHADIKALLEAYNVYPIFLVTNNVYHYYNHLLNNEINSNGKVLRLADFETAIVDAITEALEELCVDTRRQLSNY